MRQLNTPISWASAFGLSATTYSYDSRNNLTGASLPGGLSATNSYDALNRRLTWSISKAGSNLLSRTCTRNPLGFRTNETIAAGLDALAGPATQTRTHDAADRITLLTQSGPSATNQPSYDAVGNVTQLVRTVIGQTFTTRHAYDGNRRLLNTTRLRNAPDGSSVTTSVMQLEYDGQGLLLQITEDGTIRRLVRDRTDQLARPLLETDSSGNPLRFFLWANGKLLAQVETNGTIRIAHSDELGRILALTDGSGGLTDEMAYHPYGQLIAHSGTNDIPFAYMGDYGVWNAGNGLYLARHRTYDATLMRFLQPDPIGINGGYNLYAFANGNPLWFIDPSGQIAIVDDAAFWASVVAVAVTYVYTQTPAGQQATQDLAGGLAGLANSGAYQMSGPWQHPEIRGSTDSRMRENENYWNNVTGDGKIPPGAGWGVAAVAAAVAAKEGVDYFDRLNSANLSYEMNPVSGNRYNSQTIRLQK